MDKGTIEKTGEEMLKIEITLLPAGIDVYKRLVSIINIWNDNTGSFEIGNYGYSIAHESDPEIAGTVKGFARREDIVLSLLKRVLDDWDENKETL